MDTTAVAPEASAHATTTLARRERRMPIILLKATADMPERFEEIVSIDDIDYLTQAVGLTALFNGAIDNDSGRFDPAKARTLIEAYNESLPASDAGYKIGIFRIYQNTFTQTNSVVSAMVDKLLEAFKNVVGVAFGAATIDQMTTAITDAFTDLKAQEDGAGSSGRRRRRRRRSTPTRSSSRSRTAPSAS